MNTKQKFPRGGGDYTIGKDGALVPVRKDDTAATADSAATEPKPRPPKASPRSAPRGKAFGKSKSK